MLWRKFAELHGDRCGGCTSAKAMWESAKSSNQQLIMPNDHDGEVKICTCCTEYMAWKKNHPDECRKLQQYADRPFHYKVFPEKQVTVMQQGERVVYTPLNVLALHTPAVTTLICVHIVLSSHVVNLRLY